MTRAELVKTLLKQHPALDAATMQKAVRTVMECMVQALEDDDRVEIRGFGAFSLHYRQPRQGRNPKTGQRLPISGGSIPHFKPGKALRERVAKCYQQ